MNGKESKCGLKIPRCFAAIFTSNKAYPLVDKIVVAYVGIVLFFQVLLQISPVITLLAKTPLYSIQTYLGLLGAFLIFVDCITTKRIWQGKYCLLLWAILALAGVASVRTLGYGIRENLFKLCWMAIQFALMYTCAFRLDREKFEKYIKAIFYVLLVIWFAACCVSLYQYVNQIGYKYVVNPLAQDASENRQGFFDNRLFGIFYTLNHAAYISLFFLVIAVVCMVREKRILVKVCLVIVELVLLSYVILSGSRSAMISLLACGAVMPWFAVRNTLKLRGILKPLVCGVVSLAVAVVCYFGYQGMKSGLTQVPYLKQLIAYNAQMKDDGVTKPTTQPATNATVAPTTESTAPTTDSTEETTETAPTEAPPEAPTVEPTQTPVITPTYNEDILNRDYLEEDISNDRMDIWSDYIHLYKEIGLLGLSPGNYMPYIMENFPDLYIVSYIKANYPAKYNSGIIYHVHSGYMMVYVSAGIAGILSLALFILLYLIRLIALIFKNKKMSGLFIGAFALVIAGALSAIFDEGPFFQNNVQTTIFWIALGILMREQLVKAAASAEESEQA